MQVCGHEALRRELLASSPFSVLVHLSYALRLRTASRRSRREPGKIAISVRRPEVLTLTTSANTDAEVGRQREVAPLVELLALEARPLPYTFPPFTAPPITNIAPA